MKRLSSREAESLALAAFTFLANDRERLDRFLSLSGLTVETLRQASRTPGFLIGVLDYFSSDEALLTTFAAGADLPPEQVEQARIVLSGDAWRDDG
jgi:hypothetical protein